MAQHISIRVPWKDNGYSGLVCDKPCYNTACLRLKNIALSRNDEREAELAGKSMCGHEKELPCVSEGSTFMSSVSHKKTTNHPYKKNNSKSHEHFLETELVYPPFSLPARPFGWTMLSKTGERKNDNINRLTTMHNIDYDQNREPELGFNTIWVQDATNQRAIFGHFYHNVIPHSSLVIPYSKQVPFIEDAKRVVMGIGFVENVVPPPEYNHTDDGEIRSILWETMIGHTIRDERSNGFLFPYREMMEYAEEHSDFDMRSVTVFAEDEYFDEFSYATEQLSYDAVISVLLQTIKALRIVKECIPGNWDECIKWANSRLTEVWKDRGAFPGAGMMLYAMGFKSGLLIAEEVKNNLSDADSYIEKFEKAIMEPDKHLTAKTAATINKTEQNSFIRLNDKRKNLFWLLSRFSLSLEQAFGLFNRGYTYYNSRGEAKEKKTYLKCSDAEMIENPYIIYEKTRLLEQEFQVPLRNVDMAVFPPKSIGQNDLLPNPSFITAENDERRVRAIAVSVLERETGNGHTIYPQIGLVSEINELPLDPYCSVTGDIMDSQVDFFKGEFAPVEMKNSGTAYQLVRIQEFEEIIRVSVNKRVNTLLRHQVDEDWGKIVDDAFSDSELTDSEKRARQEKIAILKELAEARLSVLVGGAGTGKTTLLALLCKSLKVQSGGILLLAPTGKARVRMDQAMQSQGVKVDAKTIAQFLLRNNRYDVYTGRYRLSNTDAENVPDTVIIDECSMLTEEMFGALMQALKKNAKRIILVGDPKQLPPIGAGRPFVDLVNHLKKSIPDFPRVGKSYGELTVTRRQQNDDGSVRYDTILSEWYADTDAELDNNIFSMLQQNQCGKNLAFKTWKSPEELEQLILETIAEETEMSDIDDVDGFDISLGGKANGEWMNFGNDPQMIENWQILSAYRNNPAMGSAVVNRMVHGRYRVSGIQGNTYKKRTTKNPLGTDGIVYGDKVINIRNQKKDGFPEKDCDNFVANGEVGIVERIWQKPKDKSNTHQIRFSSQPKCSYNWPSAVSDENASDLELAYALTVHKAQGSEFGKVILVIGEPSGLLSREMLYTALTRQKEKIIILYNEEAYHLRDYSLMIYSDIACRFTCLFEQPDIVEFQRKFYEAALIHKTERGELVRSKSEVIVANALYNMGIEYTYEKDLDLGIDGIKSPDFTIEDAESGMVFYWEHCGMMTKSDYRHRWEAKRIAYEKHGIIEGENLIVSYDKPDGGIDSQEIKQLIEKFL